MNTQEAKSLVESDFKRRFNGSKRLKAILEKVENGRADYGEAQSFAEEIGALLIKALRSQPLESLPREEVAEGIIRQMLKQNRTLASEVAETVQTELNRASRLSIKAKPPNFKESRIDGLVDLVKEAETEEAFLIATGEPVQTYTQSVIDEWVKTNASFQKKLGLGTSTIVRRWSGSFPSHDTNHTDWCKDLAGAYPYGDNSKVPKDVWRRHRGCRCQVLFYPSGSVTGNITALAKGERDTEQVLWNTGKKSSGINARARINKLMSE